MMMVTLMEVHIHIHVNWYSSRKKKFIQQETTHITNPSKAPRGATVNTLSKIDLFEVDWANSSKVEQVRCDFHSSKLVVPKLLSNKKGEKPF